MRPRTDLTGARQNEATHDPGFYESAHLWIRRSAKAAGAESGTAWQTRRSARALHCAHQRALGKDWNHRAPILVARVDVGKLKFKQEDGRNRNDVTVVCGIFDQDGNYVTGIQKVLEMRFRDETLAGLSSGLSVRTTLKTSPGKYMVRMVVRDSEAQEITSLSRTLEIP